MKIIFSVENMILAVLRIWPLLLNTSPFFLLILPIPFSQTVDFLRHFLKTFL
jgi:hypothetical protein